MTKPNDAEELHGERLISRGLSRVARILDTKAWGCLRDVFAEDVVFDYGDGRDREGIASLESHVRSFLDQCGPTQHLIGNMLIDVTGDDAVSHAYVQARHQRRGEPIDPIFDSSGEYLDRWKRSVDGWKIVRRDATWHMHSGDPSILGAEAGDLG